MLLDSKGQKQTYQYVSSIDDPSQKYIKPLVENWLEASIWAFSADKEDFQIKDIVGGANTNWKFTPLGEIYNYHIRNGLDDLQAQRVAGQDVGRIAKRVMCNSNHNYELLDITRGYMNSKVYKRCPDNV